MNYPFECPRCGLKREISMPMSEYTNSGHYCECGTEMVREIKSLVCGMSIDHTNSFFRRNN